MVYFPGIGLEVRAGERSAGDCFLVEAGKIGRPLASLLEKSKNIFDMETFRIDDDRILTDIHEIHRYITEFFKEWFAGEGKDTEGMHAEEVDWARLLTDRAYYD